MSRKVSPWSPVMLVPGLLCASTKSSYPLMTVLLLRWRFVLSLADGSPLSDSEKIFRLLLMLWSVMGKVSCHLFAAEQNGTKKELFWHPPEMSNLACFSHICRGPRVYPRAMSLKYTSTAGIQAAPKKGSSEERQLRRKVAPKRAQPV